MRLNSEASLQLARSVLRQYGNDWSKMRAAGHLDPDGVLVVPSPPTPSARPAPVDPASTAPAE